VTLGAGGVWGRVSNIGGGGVEAGAVVDGRLETTVYLAYFPIRLYEYSGLVEKGSIYT